MQAGVTFLAETPEVVLLLHFLNSLMYLQLGSWGKCFGGEKGWLHQHSLLVPRHYGGTPPHPKKHNEPSAPVSMQPPVNLTQTWPWPLQVWFDYLSPAPHRHGWGFCRCTVVVLVTGGSSSCSCTVDVQGGAEQGTSTNRDSTMLCLMNFCLILAQVIWLYQKVR